MEAGYDYLLLRRRLQRPFLGFLGIFLMVLGALLLSGSGAYYGYAAQARSGLDQLVVAENTFSNPGKLAAPLSPISPSDIAGQRVFPGGAIGAGAWEKPLSFEPGYYFDDALLGEFAPVDAKYDVPLGALSPSTRIMVPALGIDSAITELGILDLGDSRAYETPNNTVGHIPETANGGESGSSWFFGHLESPIIGEGSVFRDLPEIPGMLREGRNVYVVTDNGANQHLYRITSTQVVHQNDMQLYDTGRATIHMVVCVPRLVYDYRLIVSGELVGIR